MDPVCEVRLNSSKFEDSEKDNGQVVKGKWKEITKCFILQVGARAFF